MAQTGTSTDYLSEEERSRIRDIFKRNEIPIEDSYDEVSEDEGVVYHEYIISSGDTNAMHLGYLQDDLRDLEKSDDIGYWDEPNESGFYAKHYHFFHYPEESTNAARQTERGGNFTYDYTVTQEDDDWWMSTIEVTAPGLKNYTSESLAAKLTEMSTVTADIVDVSVWDYNAQIVVEGSDSDDVEDGVEDVVDSLTKLFSEKLNSDRQVGRSGDFTYEYQIAQKEKPNWRGTVQATADWLENYTSETLKTKLQEMFTRAGRLVDVDVNGRDARIDIEAEDEGAADYTVKAVVDSLNVLSPSYVSASKAQIACQVHRARKSSSKQGLDAVKLQASEDSAFQGYKKGYTEKDFKQDKDIVRVYGKFDFENSYGYEEAAAKYKAALKRVQKQTEFNRKMGLDSAKLQAANGSSERWRDFRTYEVRLIPNDGDNWDKFAIYVDAPSEEAVKQYYQGSLADTYKLDKVIPKKLKNNGMLNASRFISVDTLNRELSPRLPESFSHTEDGMGVLPAVAINLGNGETLFAVQGDDGFMAMDATGKRLPISNEKELIDYVVKTWED